MKHKELYWSARKGLWEWTADDQAEVAARIEAIRKEKQARGYCGNEYNVEALRQATAVYGCVGNGSRRRVNSLIRNY